MEVSRLPISASHRRKLIYAGYTSIYSLSSLSFRYCLRLSLDMGSMNFRESGKQRSAFVLQDEVHMLQEENESLLEKITERCIRQMGRTLQDVIREWITKLNNREIDRTRMPLNHAEMVTAGTHVCKKNTSTTLPYNTGYQIFVLCLPKTSDEIMKCTLYICKYIL